MGSMRKMACGMLCAAPAVHCLLQQVCQELRDLHAGWASCRVQTQARGSAWCRRIPHLLLQQVGQELRVVGQDEREEVLRVCRQLLRQDALEALVALWQRLVLHTRPRGRRAVLTVAILPFAIILCATQWAPCGGSCGEACCGWATCGGLTSSSASYNMPCDARHVMGRKRHACSHADAFEHFVLHLYLGGRCVLYSYQSLGRLPITHAHLRPAAAPPLRPCLAHRRPVRSRPAAAAAPPPAQWTAPATTPRGHPHCAPRVALAAARRASGPSAFRGAPAADARCAPSVPRRRRGRPSSPMRRWPSACCRCHRRMPLHLSRGKKGGKYGGGCAPTIRSSSTLSLLLGAIPTWHPFHTRLDPAPVCLIGWLTIPTWHPLHTRLDPTPVCLIGWLAGGLSIASVP